MNNNKSIADVIDLLINTAVEQNLYIDYIAIGSKLMLKLSEELSLLADPENSMGLIIKSISMYRETSIRETEVESITIKYLLSQEPWISLDNE